VVRLYSAAEMRKADRLAVQAGVSSLGLMENAGRAVARLVRGRLPPAGSGPSGAGFAPDVVILAGKGNNGGDGLVAARLLAENGRRVEVVLTEPGGNLTGDARANYESLTRQGSVRPRVLGQDIDKVGLLSLLKQAKVVVDALLGTGSKGAPRGAAREAVELVERVRADRGGEGRPETRPRARTQGKEGRPPSPFILAVDVPSGLDADTGRAAGPAVRADATVTFAGVKAGLAFPEARDYTGTIFMAPIGIPASCLGQAWREGTESLHWLLPGEAAALLPERPVTGHKGTFGHIWIAAGSPGFTGAAILAALGALRAGAGLVTVACPSTSRPLVASGLPEALTLGLPEGPDGRLEAGAAAELLVALAQATSGGGRRDVGDGPRPPRGALVAGPGLGAVEPVGACVSELIRRSPVPLVLDADALNSLALLGPAALPGVFEPVCGRAVLTPHPGEMARLLGRTTADVQADRPGTAVRAAREWGVVVVLKGAGTIVASPEGEAWVNATGNPGMATAGSGDVLSGAIGAFLAQGLPPLQAALLGVSAHGLSGDLAAADIGSRGLLARDLAHGLAPALDSLAGAEGYGPVLLGEHAY